MINLQEENNLVKCKQVLRFYCVPGIPGVVLGCDDSHLSHMGPIIKSLIVGWGTHNINKSCSPWTSLGDSYVQPQPGDLLEMYVLCLVPPSAALWAGPATGYVRRPSADVPASLRTTAVEG